MTITTTIRRSTPSTRAGFSLLEMVIVLVLAGVIGSSAMTLFSTHNRLNSVMTTAGQSQENARSAADALASDLRPVARGAIVQATSTQLIVRAPLAVGVVCDRSGSYTTLYFALDGASLSTGQIDGFASRDSTGRWSYTAMSGSDIMSQKQSGSGQSACTANGGGTSGSASDYMTFNTGYSISFSVGQLVMFYTQRIYRFSTSTIDPATRGLFRGRSGSMVELAQDFASSAQFQYHMYDVPGWHNALSGGYMDKIDRVRILANVVGDPRTTGSAAVFSLVREIPLRNFD